MSNYRIWPLNTGTITVDKGGYITRGKGLGLEVDIPAVAWYLSDGEHKLLVDTGMCASELADWHHHGSRQEEGQAVHQQLEKLGVEPQEIELIIFTHLHWDHCHNLDRFPRARLMVSASEMEFALEPIPPYYKSYEYRLLGVEAPFIGRKFELMEGESEVLPGITVFPTPGHSPGHQSMAVDTEAGVHVITGDAVFAYANLEPDGEHLKFSIMGRFADIVAAWRSLEEIVRRAQSKETVLPGHDALVFEAESYPRS